MLEQWSKQAATELCDGDSKYASNCSSDELKQPKTEFDNKCNHVLVIS